MNDFTPEQVLEAMTGILIQLDVKMFRAMSEAGDEISDDDVLEAMHRTRLIHPGINRTQKQISRIWLNSRSKS